jgi:hypothetical protein
MRWANPLAFALLLLIIPLLLVRSRQPRRRIAVGNLYLWSQAATQQTVALSRRLQRVPSVFLQVAIIATIAAAVARPLVRLPGERVAIVLDTSMSMAARHGDGSRLDAAKVEAREQIKAVGLSGRVRLWLAGGMARDAGEFTPDDPRLLATLDQVDAGGGTAALDDAVRQAIGAQPTPQRVIVVTDAVGQGAPPGVQWITVGEPTPNVAITAFAVRRGDAHANRVEALLQVSNYGSGNSTRELVVEGPTATLHRRSIDIPGGGSAEVALPIGNDEGVFVARLLPHDGLHADDERRVVISGRERLRARLVNGSQYVRAALTASEGVSVIDRDGDTDPVDLIVCEQCTEIPAGPAIVGVLIVPPPSVARDAHPVIWHGRPHPVLDGLKTHLAHVVPVSSPRPVPAQSILATAGDLPILAAYERDNRRIVELRVDPTRSALALDPLFPMLVANALDWLAASNRNQPMLTAGEPLHWMLRQPATVEPLFVGPNEQEKRLTSESGTLISAATDAVGLHHVRIDGRDTPVVVNPDAARESNVSNATGRPIADAFIGNNANQSPGTDFSRVLLFAAIGLLAMEWRQRVRSIGRG